MWLSSKKWAKCNTSFKPHDGATELKEKQQTIRITDNNYQHWSKISVLRKEFSWFNCTYCACLYVHERLRCSSVCSDSPVQCCLIAMPQGNTVKKLTAHRKTPGWSLTSVNNKVWIWLLPLKNIKSRFTTQSIFVSYSTFISVISLFKF